MSTASAMRSQSDALGALAHAKTTGLLPQLLAVDRHSGEPTHPDARALFMALPSLTPLTPVEELLGAGLVARLPRHGAQALAQPRYRVGRALFVRARLSPKPLQAFGPVGGYSPSGALGFTHRAVLRGQTGDSFVVELEGAPGPLVFKKSEIFAWNEPCGVPALSGTVCGVHIDFKDPVWRAHVAAGFLEIAHDVGDLDLLTPGAAEAQARLLHRLAAGIRMQYAGRGQGYAGARAGSLLSQGQGVCFVQSAVTAAYLQMFARLLAFDVQLVAGRTQRLGLAHGFVVVTLRPSLTRYVVDIPWREPLTELRLAFFGPSWGHDRRVDSFVQASTDPRRDTVAMADVDLPMVDAGGS